MKYRNQGISPNHTLSIHLTESEKSVIDKLKKKMNNKSDCYVSVGEITRRAIVEKLKKFNLKNKRLKKRTTKPYRISITATDKLYKEIKLAVEMSDDKTISEFMRNAVFEYYKLKVK